jgi:hypothetical protein
VLRWAIRPSRPDRNAVEEQCAGGSGHVIAEHRERVGERMAAAVIRQDADHADNHRCDQDDKPIKKLRPCAVSVDIARGQLPGSGAILLYYASSGPRVKGHSASR